MAGNYTLELELFSMLNSSVSGFEIWAEGSQFGSAYTISASGSTISVTIPYGGALPTSLEFRFNDTDTGSVDTIEVRSVKINDKYVNTGNFLSSNTLNDGQVSIVDVTSADFIFDANEPAASEFTTGATHTFTAGADKHRSYSNSDDKVFDLLDGNDNAALGGGDDKVNGGGGRDTIRGGAGNDLIAGGADDDRLFGQDGNDQIYGGTGSDMLFGDDGADELFGGDGNDALSGHNGDDILVGGAGDDRLSGGADNDQLFGGADNDQLTGGAGDDTLDGGDGDDLAYGGLGNDFINGGDGADILVGNLGRDIVHGDAGDDTIYVSAGEFVAGEEIYGGAGTDELILSRAMTIDFTIGVIDGLETLTGSNGDQDVTYSIQQALNFTTIDLGGGTDTSRVNISGTVDTTALGTPIVINAENSFLTGSSVSDDLIITGAQLDALIFGTGTIDFAGGSDILRLTSTSTDLNNLGLTDASINGLEEINATGAASAVTVDLRGQTENFTATGSNFDDTVIGGSGDDTITGELGNDSISGGAGNDTLYGGDGSDQINGNSGTDQIFGESGNDTFSLGQNAFGIGETIDGGDDTDTLILNSNVIVDFTTGALSNLEILRGVSGDQDLTISIDTLAQFSLVNLDDGVNDVIRTQIDGVYDAVANGVPTVSNVENGFLIGSGNDDTLTVGETEISNLVYGAGIIDFGSNSTAAGDLLRITETSTTLNTLGATDGLIVGLERVSASTAAGDVVLDLSGQTEDIIFNGSSNNDTITSGTGNDSIFAGSGNDIINAGDGDDVISSSLGNNVITGGTGTDNISTGNGNDTFNLANGDFAAGESINGGMGTDELILTNATTVDFTTGTLANLEILTGSAGNDDVTYTIQQALGFSNLINLAGGTDTSRVNIAGVVDVTALGTPTVNNVENGFLTGSTGDDTLTISGGQLDALIYGGGILDFDAGTDYVYLNTTSASLNALSATDGSIVGVERFSAQFAATGVTIDLTGQLEDFDIIGGSSGDTFTGGTGNDNIQGQAGDDFLYGGDGNDQIVAGFGNDTVYGGEGNEFIYAGVGTNFIYGENGNDYLNSGTGNDLLDGGAGIDIAAFFGITTGVTVDLRIAGAQDTIGAGIDTFVSIENLYGSGQNDTLTGDSNANTILGDFGNDTIDGGDGNDFLDGQDGIDTVTYISASAGVTVDLSNTNYQDTIGAGVDRILSFENLTGSNFNDTLTGDNADNVINGGDETAGSLTNLILNGSFEDTSNGTGSGVVPPDWTTIGTGWGVYAFGGGRGSDGSYSMPLGGWTAATGGGVSQTVTTVAGQNYDLLLDGGLSFGGAGDATLRVTVEDAGGIISQNDIVSISSAGMEQIFFNFQANSTSTTISFEFVAYTGSDKDFDIDNIRLYETNGDVLYGGDGLDTLTGGTGNDRFVFEATTAFNDIDVITDFNTAERDVLDLSDLINDFEIGINPIQDNITNFLQITDDGTDSSVFVDTTGSGTFGAATQIATLQGVTGLTDEQALLDQSLIYVYDN